MDVIIVRDKLKTGIKVRLDNLTIKEYVYIKHLIECDLAKQEDYLKQAELDPSTDEIVEKNIQLCERMIERMDNEKNVCLDCYSFDVEGNSIDSNLRKYKKLKI